MGLNFLDQYSLLHLSGGVVAYFWGVPLKYWVLVHTSFELLENTKYGMKFINKYFKLWPGGKPYSDSLINSLGDLVSAIVGWLLAYYLDHLGTKYGWYSSYL